MLAVDLSICVFGEDQTDSACMLNDSIRQLETSAEVVSQWEAALLQEMLQECLHAAPDSEAANAQVGQTSLSMLLYWTRKGKRSAQPPLYSFRTQSS